MKSEAYKESLKFKHIQNQELYRLLNEWYFVPTNVCKKISSQYNRSIFDIRQIIRPQGHDIKSVKRYGLWGFVLT